MAIKIGEFSGKHLTKQVEIKIDKNGNMEVFVDNKFVASQQGGSPTVIAEVLLAMGHKDVFIKREHFTGWAPMRRYIKGVGA